MTLKFYFDIRNGVVTLQNLLNEVLHKSLAQYQVNTNFYLFLAAILDLTLKMTLKCCFNVRNGFVTPENLLNEVSHIYVAQVLVLI